MATTHEALIDGYVHGRRDDRGDSPERGGKRETDRSAGQAAGSVVAKYSPIRARARPVDARSNRDVVNSRSGRVRGRSVAEIVDAVLTFACWSAWGGLLSCFVLFVIWAAWIFLTGSSHA